jgi:predicted acylesterase/phospholipase RssA
MPKIGIVLSGGMAKGAYQLGFLKAFDELFSNSNIACISASSVGALNAYAWATGKIDTAIDMWNLVAERGERQIITDVLRGSILQGCIENIVDSKDIVREPFYVALFNYSKRTIEYKDISLLSSEEIIQTLRASVAMPLYNKPVTINRADYFDGALVDNIPVFPVLKQEIDFIICVHFDKTCYIFEDERLGGQILSITFSDNKIVSNSLSLDIFRIEQMIKTGYEKSKEILSCLQNCPNDMLQRKIKQINNCENKNGLRITGDVIVRNLNKFAIKFANRIITP